MCWWGDGSCETDESDPASKSKGKPWLPLTAIKCPSTTQCGDWLAATRSERAGLAREYTRNRRQALRCASRLTKSLFRSHFLLPRKLLIFLRQLCIRRHSRMNHRSMMKGQRRPFFDREIA